MAKVKFERTTAPTGSVEFSANPSYGGSEPLKFCQPKDYTNGGVLYSYTKGVNEKTFELSWSFMPEADYQDMITFFEDVIDGAAHPFTYTDENAATHTVRLLTENINFKKVLKGRSGGITLRKE